MFCCPVEEMIYRLFQSLVVGTYRKIYVRRVLACDLPCIAVSLGALLLGSLA